MFFQSSYAAMAAVLANVVQTAFEPFTLPAPGPLKGNTRRGSAPALTPESLRRVVLNPSLAPAPRRRVRPGCSSFIFHP